MTHKFDLFESFVLQEGNVDCTESFDARLSVASCGDNQAFLDIQAERSERHSENQ